MTECEQILQTLYEHVLVQNGICANDMDRMIYTLTTRGLPLPKAVHLVGELLSLGTLDGTKPS